MPTPKQLQALQASRRHGIGRLLLLARRDFLSRLAAKMHIEGGGDLAMQARGRMLPYIDVQGTRSVDLARRMDVSKQAVARMVNELERDGLLVRQADSDDGRASLIKFTDAGLAYLTRMHKCIKQIERDYERALGQDRLQLVRETLAAIAYAGKDENQQTEP